MTSAATTMRRSKPSERPNVPDLLGGLRQLFGGRRVDVDGCLVGTSLISREGLQPMRSIDEAEVAVVVFQMPLISQEGLRLAVKHLQTNRLTTVT